MREKNVASYVSRIQFRQKLRNTEDSGRCFVVITVVIYYVTLCMIKTQQTFSKCPRVLLINVVTMSIMTSYFMW